MSAFEWGVSILLFLLNGVLAPITLCLMPFAGIIGYIGYVVAHFPRCWPPPLPPNLRE